MKFSYHKIAPFFLEVAIVCLKGVFLSASFRDRKQWNIRGFFFSHTRVHKYIFDRVYIFWTSLRENWPRKWTESHPPYNNQCIRAQKPTRVISSTLYTHTNCCAFTHKHIRPRHTDVYGIYAIGRVPPVLIGHGDECWTFYASARPGRVAGTVARSRGNSLNDFYKGICTTPSDPFWPAPPPALAHTRPRTVHHTAALYLYYNIYTHTHTDNRFHRPCLIRDICII